MHSSPLPLSPRTGLPQSILYGNRTAMSLDSLLNSRSAARRAAIPEADRVLGFTLPSWQRPAVWSNEQQARFIESIYLGLPLGEAVIVRRGEDGDAGVHRLLDGQQRLRAIERWVTGQLSVGGVRLTDLEERDQSHFGFSYAMSVFWVDDKVSEATLRLIYERLNFGGTPHAPEHHPDHYRRTQS